MKKFMLITGIIILLVFIFLYNFWGLDLYLMNKMNRSQLPDEYKNYQNIDTKKPIVFGQHEMKLMWNDSFEPIQHFISSKGDMIIMTSEIPKNRDQEEVEEEARGGGVRFHQDFHFYKLDKEGKIKDHYVYKRTNKNRGEELFGDFIVNKYKKYYRTWVTDGDTLAKPIIIQNEDLKWDKEQQISLYHKIFEETDYFDNVSKSYPEQETTYYMDGKWYQMRTNTKLTERIYNHRRPNGWSNLFRHYSSKDMAMVPNSFPEISPVYFQRTEVVELTHSVGGGSASSTAKNWKGELYCQLPVDKDTLKFKISMYFEEGFTTQKFYESPGEKIRKYKAELEKQYSPYFYFADKNFNFQLFTTSDRKLYIIKPVK
ncbi:hypothetical protein [Chryseobacterium sp. 2987]|uniref:hypothetical protein n=1 Tax=Chryseobacterium sp. 2987 TaxID=2817767 RepID=UPI0028653AC1|nr:hypothetical protein [Chryseobacterium sp. 2987]MDR6923669.1 hypothetical protein [Chryseobacterium sp. 2987]